MLVVHGWWAATDDDGPGGLAVWAEDGELAADAGPGTGPAGGDHPWAANHADLCSLVGMGDDARVVGLRLPSRGSGVARRPVASPELPDTETGTVTDPGTDTSTETGASDTAPRPGRRRLRMQSWRVPVVVLPAARAIGLLRSPLPARAVAGADWRVLAELAAFADDLAARGRLLPGVEIVEGDGGPIGTSEAIARWRPVVTGPDATWLRALALALPPSATGPEVTATGEIRPASAVVPALEALLDAAARIRLRRVEPSAPRRTRRTHAGSAWLAALAGDDPWFEDATPVLTRLGDDLAAWQRDASGGVVRARFRLVEPDGAADDPWELRFALQATDEPSLVVEAGQVWAGDEPAGALAAHAPAPREALLTELGRARRLYPALSGALRTRTPERLDLPADAAHAFLRDAAPVLAAAGFGVDLPGWWGRRASRLGVRLRAGSPAQPGAVEGRAGLGRDVLVDYRWELAVGDDVLTAEELASLARVQQPLVRLRGAWVELDPAKLRRGLTLLREQPTGVATVAEVLGLLGSAGAELDGDLAGLPVIGIEADGWLGDLLSGAAEERVEPVPTPPGFTGTLRPYQERGLAWLAFLGRLGLGGVLADDMGLGKTVQLLALLAADADADAETGSAIGTGDVAEAEPAPTLLVCPMSLVGNWQREAARFAPHLRVHVHHGADRARGGEFEAAVADAHLVLTTYAVAARDAEDLREVAWRRVVLDEAQAVKNAATQQSRAVRSLPAGQRIAVTGTPVENRLADLWSVLDFANPGLLGSASSFRERYAVPIERHGDDGAAERLRTVTRPFVLRRLKTDRSIIDDLPEKLEMEVVCSLTREQAALYQAVVDDMLDKVENSEGMERRGLVLATMTKLKQVCNSPAHLLRDGSPLAGRSGKLERIEQTLEEVLAGGEKALLFTQFAEFGGMLRAHLAARFGREVPFLHGGVAKRDRDAMVARFQEPGPASPVLFVLSLKAGGTGLTLTAANHVIHVDRWWNPAVEDQATDRAFRIGQRRAVQVRKLVCAGTVEERVATMIREKRGLAARIVGSGEGWLTELSTAELRALVTLDPEAVVE